MIIDPLSFALGGICALILWLVGSVLIGFFKAIIGHQGPVIK